MDAKTISQIINELGECRGEYFQAVSPPIVQTSNFSFKSVHDFRNALQDEGSVYLYSRVTNPTVNILAEKMAALDGAEASLLFNSGAGAIFTSVLANVKSGDHIVSVADPYTWAAKLFDNVLPRFGVSTTYVDGRDIRNFEKALQQNTVVIYLETPNSWSFYLQDLEAVAALARAKNILTICDNSYCTPLYQRPVEMGIDLVLQSATKYLNGHSDVIAGVLSGSRKLIDNIFKSEYMNQGTGITPFNAWLVIRGLRTLPVRLQRVSETTRHVIAFLRSREETEEISFPLDEHFPQYSLAKKQMTGACGLFSFLLKAERCEQIEAFCNGLKHILMAVSWGGYESLIMPGIAGIRPEEFDADNVLHRRLRLYMGLEDPEYLREDLQRGFTAMASV